MGRRREWRGDVGSVGDVGETGAVESIFFVGVSMNNRGALIFVR